MKVLVISKKSVYEQLSEDPGTVALTKQKAGRARAVHDRHQKIVQKVRETLRMLGATPWFLEGAGVAFDAKNLDLVITVGGDGTFLGASHHIGSEVPLLGINSDPKTSVGHFCSLQPATLEDGLKEALRLPKRLQTKLTRMQVKVRGGVASKRVLNEALFSHVCPAATTRLQLHYQGKVTLYKCSGAWVGTGAGSTGAMLAAGAKPFPATSSKIQAVIREPFHVVSGSEVKITSRLPEAFLYLDGPYLQIPVGLGDTVTFTASSEPLTTLRYPGA